MSAISTGTHRSLAAPFFNTTLSKWSSAHKLTPPQGYATSLERAWYGASASSPLQTAQDYTDHARLLASAARVVPGFMLYQSIP